MHELTTRKTLTFAQAEGVEPLPTQLALREVSQELRAKLWGLVHGSIKAEMKSESLNHGLGKGWSATLRFRHVNVLHRMADEFSGKANESLSELKATIANGDYVAVFGLIEWLARQRKELRSNLAAILVSSRAAYRLLDGDTVVPFVSEEEGNALADTFRQLEASAFQGARAHLKAGASRLAEGDWAASIRESISSVEAVARTWEPSAQSLDPALKALQRAHPIHPALSKGFGALYGFTNDEQGIRHPLLDGREAAVDETDAIYMLGACAAFGSYLVRRHREAARL